MVHPLLDKEIFCDQVIRNQEAMFRTAKAILRQDEDAEDAVQEAICAAYANRTSLRDPARFRPWVLKILANKCYESCRRRRTTVDLADIQDCLPAPAADQAERLLRSLGEEPRDPGLLAKVSAEVMSTFKTLADPSASNIAEMVIQGNTMGATKSTRHLGDYAGGNREIRNLAERLLHTEEANAAQMKQFL